MLTGQAVVGGAPDTRRRARALLTATAVVEAAAGVPLLLSPSLVTGLLLGAPLDAPSAVVAARVAGAALIAFGGACWRARDDDASVAARGVIAAALFYNAAAVAVLAHAGAAVHLAGPLLWPTVALHASLAGWCVGYLRPDRYWLNNGVKND
jgi:hypothetical protein